MCSGHGEGHFWVNMCIHVCVTYAHASLEPFQVFFYQLEYSHAHVVNYTACNNKPGFVYVLMLSQQISLCSMFKLECLAELEMTGLLTCRLLICKVQSYRFPFSFSF